MVMKKFKISFIILGILFCYTLQGTRMNNNNNNNFTLTSSAFTHNEMIPSKYTCDGEDISPELKWSNPPADTKSFVLIVDDPDAPSKTFVHWIIFNIPSRSTHLPENTATDQFISGKTDFNGATKYGGPCPPSGTHRYFFKLYALDTMLDLKQGTTKEELLKAMEHHILAQTELIGLYQRKNK